ncbi:MAG: SBBP repeat-containing protein, partial [Bryobacteraceae bacterium]
ALDGAGNPYITGYTNSSDFPTTSGAFQPKFGGFVGQGFLLVGGDAFVSELSPDGKSLLYSTYLGGQNDDFGFGIAVDSSSNVYVTGTTISVNFPVSAGAYQTRMAGTGGQEVFPLFGNGLAAIVGGDVFVTKLNPAKSGAAGLVYSTFIGGTDDDVGSSIFVDASGNAYVAGYTLSSNYPTTPGAFQSTWAGAEQQNFFFHFGDAFITKVNPTGTALIFSTYIGGSGDDWISSLAADASGNVIATGSTTSRNFPVTAGSYQTSYHGPTSIPPAVDMFFGDAFLLKLNAGGTALVFSTYFGGAGDDCALAMTTDAAGNIYLAGFTNSADFPVTAGAFQPTLAGPGYLTTTQTFGDGFLAQFSSSGSPLYVTYLGGTQNDAVASVAITPSGIVYLSGMTKSTDFPTLAAAQPKNASTILSTGLGSNAFVTSISGFFASGTGPSISSVLNATGEAPVIAQNTFIEVKGANLAPDTRTWQTSDFVNNQLPTSLDGVGVTVDGKPGFIYYISPTQVNVLTPLDSTTGPVQVQLKNNLSTSSDATVTMQTYAPGFYQFLPAAYVAAVHLTGALIGPTTLYPGLSTPASPGETIEVYGNGFGQTSPEIVNGSLTAFGTLPVMPTIKVGGIVASVSFAGVVGPGLYQFNVVLPGNLPAGDNSFVATFNGFSTQANALISISN